MVGVRRLRIINWALTNPFRALQNSPKFWVLIKNQEEILYNLANRIRIPLGIQLKILIFVSFDMPEGGL